MNRTVSVLVVLVASLLAASCAVSQGGNPPQAEPPAPEVSLFQQWLDAEGIDFLVPQSGKAILVNIPAYELIAFEDGVPALRSRVIVGTPRNPTPILRTYTTVVRFRPTWQPTPDMVASGEYVDRRWPAGADNPLGLAAIRLEPGLLVYLHDTNQRHLFEEATRALSHGCVRVDRWEELIAWLLEVDRASVREWANGGRTFDRPVPGVPVFLGYFTRFPDDGGVVRYFADIYAREVGPATADLSTPSRDVCPVPAGDPNSVACAC